LVVEVEVGVEVEEGEDDEGIADEDNNVSNDIWFRSERHWTESRPLLDLLPAMVGDDGE
jgi:hypothetical protein